LIHSQSTAKTGSGIAVVGACCEESGIGAKVSIGAKASIGAGVGIGTGVGIGASSGRDAFGPLPASSVVYNGGVGK